MILENFTSEEKFYLIGFFQGDGSLSEYSRNRGKLQLEVSIVDKPLILKIKELFDKHYPGLTVSLYERERNTNFKNNSKTITLRIHELSFRNYLKQYVPSGKKCFLVKPPYDLDEENIRHYLRGLTDADGSVGISKSDKPFYSICTSSDEIKNFVVNEMYKIIGIKKDNHRNKRDNVFNLILLNEDAIKWCNYLYDSSSIFLPRKKMVQESIFPKWVRTVKKLERKRFWTKEEIKIIRNKTYSIEEMQKLTNRSKNAIKTKLFKLKTT